MSSSLVRVLHSLVVVVILGILAYDAYVNFRKLNVTTQTFNVVNSNELVPPALTFCIKENTAYDFDIKVYNQTVARGDYLQQFPGDSAQLGKLGGQVNRCWILKSPSNQALIKNPPPIPNVPALVFTTIRDTTYETVKQPLLVNIFDPLQQDTLFDFNRFLLLDPDVNRAIQFTRTRVVDINGKISNDIKFNIIDEYRDPAIANANARSINQFTFRADSFGIEESKTVRVTTIQAVIFDLLTFLGVLIGRIYFPLVGEGKYKPWGYIHQLVGYYPVEHIKGSKGESKDIEQGWSKINNEGLGINNNNYSPNVKGESEDIGNNNSPNVKDILSVYLERVRKAKYSD